MLEEKTVVENSENNNEEAIENDQLDSENIVESEDNGVEKNEEINAKVNTDNKEEDDNSEPKVRSRMTAKDFIIQRQQKKIQKLNQVDNDDEDDSDSDISSDDEELITKVVSKKFAPLIERQLADDDDLEVKEFISKNPDFKEFEAKARKYMAHPSRRSLPIESIFYEVAGEKLLKLGAERQKKADLEAKNSQAGGGSNRGGESKKDIWSMSSEEFEREKNNLRRNL